MDVEKLALGAPGLTTRSKKLLATSSKKLLGAKGIATRSKDATRCKCKAATTFQHTDRGALGPESTNGIDVYRWMS